MSRVAGGFYIKEGSSTRREVTTPLGGFYIEKRLGGRPRRCMDGGRIHTGDLVASSCNSNGRPSDSNNIKIYRSIKIQS
jgi:hypothetical protein